MKKFNELKKNVNKFCQDHILGVTATAAAIGAVAGGFVVTSLVYRNPDLGYIIQRGIENDWSKEDYLAAFIESFERWN